MIQFEKHWPVLDFRKMCVLCTCLCFCVFFDFYRPFLSPSCSFKPSCYAATLTWIHTLFCLCCSLNDAETVTPLVSLLILTLCLSISYCLAFCSLPLTMSVWISLSSSSSSPSPAPPLFLISQRRSWIWKRATGRTSMSSQELWNFFSVSFLSPWCHLASSPTSWRQSVSDKLQSPFKLFVL